MWWSRRRLSIVLLVGLAACGFQPLYGQRGATGGSMPDELAAIRVVPIADRTGQLLYNNLRDRLNPHGKPVDPRYLLDIALREEREELALRGDETATRANLRLMADYVLRRAVSEGEPGKDDIVTKGQSRITTSYDILDSQYATIISIEDARARATRVLSDDIQARLAVALSESMARVP
jgi:LPS-assembly lipoprotein